MYGKVLSYFARVVEQSLCAYFWDVPKQFFRILEKHCNTHIEKKIVGVEFVFLKTNKIP